MNDDKTVQDEEKKLPEDSDTMPENELPVDNEVSTPTSAPEDSTEIDTAPTTEVAMPEDEVAVDHSDHTHTATPSDDSDDSIPSTWIKLENGKFKCSECENEVEPETNTIEGVVKADLDQIKADLKQYPTKVVYGICPVCGMEYVFRLKGEDLYLEPSDLEK